MKKLFDIAVNMAITAVILLASFAVSILLQNDLGIPEHVTTTIAFAVFLISMMTRGYVYGIIAAVIGTLAINYTFTFPYFHLNFTIPTNLFSAITMIIIAVLTSTLTTKVKRQEAVKAEGEMERMRANLLRAVSHDLRTPLTTIYGASSALLENREAMTEQQQIQMLRSIREDSEWLVRMVENLLSVTRIDTGKVKLVKTPTVLEELVDSCVLKFRKRYPDQELLIDYDSRQVFMRGEEIKLTQTEYNIVLLLSEHCGKMMTYSAIIKAIWGYPDDGSIKKLQVNMANIRKKFGAKPGEDNYIINEIGVGYRMNSEKN